MVEPPDKACELVGIGDAPGRTGGSAGGGVRVKTGLVDSVAGHRKIGLAVDVVAEHEPPGRDTAAQKVIGKQLVNAMRGAPGQRHGRIDDVAVHNDLGTRAERAHHAADRRADLAGRVVVDNIIIIMTFQVVIQGLDAIPFMVRHADDGDPMGDEGRGRAGLVCRAKAHKQVNFIFSCIQIQQQVLHITLYAALHTKMVADHENTHRFVLFAFDFGFPLSFAATLRRLTRVSVILPIDVPFGTPKGTEKGPATSDSAGGPA